MNGTVSHDNFIGLLDAVNRSDALTPHAFGLVYHYDDQYRFIVNIHPTDWPEGKRIPEFLLALAERIIDDPTHVHKLQAITGLLPGLCGWLFTGSGWYVENPWPSSEGSLSQHPSRHEIRMSIYLDQHTADIDALLHHLDTDRNQLEPKTCPAEGWNLDNSDTITTALYLYRQASIRGNNA